MRTYDYRENDQDTIVQTKTIQRKGKEVQSPLQMMANNSSRVRQLQQYQEMANRNVNNRMLFQLKNNNKGGGLNFPIQRKENKTGLPDNLKAGVENLSGFSLDDVNVHYNSDKPAQINAHAYAQGTDIHLASGQEKHLPHEAWHIVQQKQGRVKPTTEIGGAAVNDNGSLEKEADVMGAKSLQKKKNKSQEEGNFSNIKKNNALQLNDQKFELTSANKENFIANLKSSIATTADSVLAQVGQSTADCPYIVYWFNYYQDKAPQHIQESISRYLKGGEINSASEAIERVTAKVKAGLEENIKNGSLKAVPSDVPKGLEEKHIESKDKLETIQRCTKVNKVLSKQEVDVAFKHKYSNEIKKRYSRKSKKYGDDLRNIVIGAYRLIDKALNHIDSKDKHYIKWMNDSDTDNVKKNFENMRTRLETEQIEFKQFNEDMQIKINNEDFAKANGQKLKDVKAAYDNTEKNKNRIFINDEYFWKSKGKPGLIIHELSHMVAGTLDITYGKSDCKELAFSNPTEAVKNADNYRFFAESVK